MIGVDAPPIGGRPRPMVDINSGLIAATYTFAIAGIVRIG
jgi:hypothetical protein